MCISVPKTRYVTQALTPESFKLGVYYQKNFCGLRLGVHLLALPLMFRFQELIPLLCTQGYKLGTGLVVNLSKSRCQLQKSVWYVPWSINKMNETYFGALVRRLNFKKEKWMKLSLSFKMYIITSIKENPCISKKKVYRNILV